MKLTLKRTKQFYAALVFYHIKIYDSQNNIIAEDKLSQITNKEYTLPTQIYTVDVTLKSGLHSPHMSFTIYPTSQTVEVELFADAIHIIGHLLWFSPPCELQYTISYLDAAQKPAAAGYEKRSIGNRMAIFASKIFYYTCTGLSIFFILSVLSLNYQLDTAAYTLALEGTDAYTKATMSLMGGYIGYPICALVFSVAANLFSRLIKKLNRKKRPQNNRILDFLGEHYILYLRSFHDDDLTKKEVHTLLKPNLNEEELLVSVFDNIAPVVAIGKPTDKYLPAGAYRVYATDDTWQDEIRKMSHTAKYTLLRLGSTEGFWWEVRYCLENVPVEKLIFAIPATSDVSLVANLYMFLNQYGIDAAYLSIDIKKSNKTSISGFCVIRNNKAEFIKIKTGNMLYALIPTNEKIQKSLESTFPVLASKTKILNTTTRALLSWGMAALILFVSIGGGILSYAQSNIIRYPLDIIEMVDDIEPLKTMLDQYGYQYAYIGANGLYVQGALYATDEALITSFYYETLIFQRMTEREYEILLTNLDDYGKNMMILSKKHLTDEEYAAYSNLYYDLVQLGADIELSEDTLTYNTELTPEVIDELLLRLALLGYEDDSQVISYQEQLDFLIAERATLLYMYLDGYDVASTIRFIISTSE